MFLFKLVRRAIAFLLLLVIVIPVFALGKLGLLQIIRPSEMAM